MVRTRKEKEVVICRVNSLDDLDTLHTARLVTPVVFCCSTGIGNADTLDPHGEGCLGVIYLASRPFNNVFIILWISTGPDAETNISGCLRIILASVRIFVLECSNDLTINVEVCLVLLPVGRVVVVQSLRRLHFMPDGAIIGGGVALAEVVGLHVGGVSTDPLPIDLIQIVALDHD